MSVASGSHIWRLSMVTKIGVYRRWIGPVPKENGKLIPKSDWPKKRPYKWTVRWYGSNQQRYCETFKTRKEANNRAAELQGEVSIGKADKPKSITLLEFIREHEKVMQGQVSGVYIIDQMRALEFFKNFIGGSILLQQIKPRHAEAFVAHRLNSGIRPATVNKDIRTLKRIFNLAIEPRGYLKDAQNPFVKIKQRRTTRPEIRYVSVEEYRALIRAADKLWWKTLISIAYGSALRKTEILHLTWHDIDFENQQIHVRAKVGSKLLLEWEPKGRKNRVVPMSDEAAQLLAYLQVECHEGFPYVFIFPSRLKVIQRRIQERTWKANCQVINNAVERFNVIRRRSGIRHCSVHDLRRSAITNWVRHLPIQVVQELAGHENIETTRTYYLAICPEDLEHACRTINQVLSPCVSKLTQN